jgi:photosystem II stability/assembly factor-like uncharacterized protein
MTKRISPEIYGQFSPRYIGPIGNRVSAVAGVPGDPLIYYAGCASGGIFKTSDGGTTWKPVFDKQAAAVGEAKKPEKVASIGALAVSESHHNIVWAGTGESWIRGPISIGNGVYKSADYGETWTRMGLVNSGRISKILINPKNPNEVWIAAMGSCYEDKHEDKDKQEQRGVYKTTDGGLTWTLSLWTNKNTGCSDLALDANNPSVVYAGMWEFKLRSWIRVSGGAGGGIYKSYDGGSTWKELTNGLPTGELAPDGKPYSVGKISIGVSRKNPNYVYANIETGDGEPTWDFPHVANGQLWQSTNAGYSWAVKSYNRNINARPAYYTRNEVSPDNELEVYFFSPKFSITKDGGETLNSSGFPESPGVDHHDGWIDPTNGDRMIVAHDIGVSITQNRCNSWYKIQLANAQVYTIGVDDDIPYNVYGNVQDWVAFWGPNNARIPYNFAQGDLRTGKISRGLWTMGGSGECGWTLPDPKDKDLIWSSGSGDGPNGGSIALINKKTGHTRMVTVKPNFTTGAAPKNVNYRFHWHLPLAISPHDDPKKAEAPRRVYAGSQYVHVTDSQGQNWYEISEKLTGYDEKYLQSSGGLTGDNLNVRMAYTTSAIAESPKKQGLLWVGTSDQRVWLGRQKDYRAKWQWEELTVKIKGLPKAHPGAWAMVTCIAPSNHHSGTAYITFDKHQAGDSAPYVFKTKNYGKHWTKITNGIPESVFSYASWIAEDPKCKGLLFLGTQNALYISYNDGEDWQVLPGLPPAPVSGIIVQQHFDDLVLSTFGRGFYVYDDITPLRKLPGVINKDVHLFEFKRPVYRFQDVNQPLMVPNDNDPTVGDDPASPAPISFYLKAPSDKVSITIREVKNGKTMKDIVRSIPITNSVKGINRVWWDLMSNSTQTIILRTNPPNQKGVKYCDHAHIRPFIDAIAGTSLSWMAPPGIYEVSLEVDVKGRNVVHKQQLELRKDPTSPTPYDDIILQYQLSKSIANALDNVVIDINKSEWVRYQIQEFEKTAGPLPIGLGNALKKLEKGIKEVEKELYQGKITGKGEDLARFPGKMVSNLSYLGGIVGTGDFKPTDQQNDQFNYLKAEVKRLNKKLNRQLKSVGSIDPKLKKLGLPPISLTPPKEKLCALFNSGPAF